RLAASPRSSTTCTVGEDAGGLRPLHPRRLAASPRSSTTCTVGEDAGGLRPLHPRRSGRCPLRTTPKPEGRTVPTVGGVPVSLSGRAIRLGRRRISGRGGVRASVVPPPPHTGFLLALRKSSVGTPERAGRNQRARAPRLAKAQARR